MVWLGAILVAAIAVVFNIIMRKRGCEKAYFAKHCIPKGIDVRPYYRTAFIAEVLIQIVVWAGVLVAMLFTADVYIPMTAIDLKLLAIPAAVVLAGIVNLSTNRGMINKIEEEARKKQKEK